MKAHLFECNMPYVCCCVVDISAGIIDRLIFNPVQKMMQCNGGLWSVYLSHMKHHTSPAPRSSPCREILNANCYSHMRVPDCHALNDLTVLLLKLPFPTPRASLDATRINEISHADGAWAAAAPERDKNLCHGSGIHTGGTSETGERDETPPAHLFNKYLSNSAKTWK